MGEVTAKNYLNPLTLEAKLFLNSIETYGKKCNQLDENLFQTLECVIAAIEQFLGQTLNPIVATENTKLVHPREVDSIVRIYHCGVCKMDLGKSPDKATMHLSKGHQGKKKRTREGKATREGQSKNGKENSSNVAKMPKKAVSLFSSDLPKFFNENIIIAEKLKNIPEYDVIEKELLDMVKPIFPGQSVKIYKFGSRITGVGTRNSDLDVFIDIGKTFNKFENKASETTLSNLKSVFSVLMRHNKSWQHLRSVDGARVPILKALNVKTGIECDIGFSNSLGYCNTKLMEYLFEVQPIARRMCIFLKKWLERSKLSDQISTYTISLMVIYVLQIQRHLPSIELLQFGLDAKLNVGPWIGNFIEKKITDLNIKRLDVSPANCQKQLLEYFSFYAQFNFEKFVVCPYFGRLIEVAHIEAEMPQRYSVYVESDDAVKDRALQIQKPMVVQDPIQLNHNVSKAITPRVLSNILHYFQLSQEALAALL